jgi:hypothetical protein
MATDLIRYDLLAQDALRGLVRRVLGDVARDGLPGEHHFYISFRTDAPGVKLSPRIREQHPSEMTIVLQHQFWDLDVNDTYFAVGLSFGGVPERLLVPYEALSGFFDPSVQFGLKFEKVEDTAAGGATEPAETQDVAELPTAARTAQRSAAEAPSAPAETAPAAGTGDGAQVVSLDKFRKK